MNRVDYRRDAMNRLQMHLPYSPGATMSTEQAAAILNCTSKTVVKMCKTRELIAYQLRPIPRSPYRVYRDSVQRLLDRIGDEVDLDSYLASRKRGMPGYPVKRRAVPVS